MYVFVIYRSDLVYFKVYYYFTRESLFYIVFSKHLCSLYKNLNLICCSVVGLVVIYFMYYKAVQTKCDIHMNSIIFSEIHIYLHLLFYNSIYYISF